MLLESHVEFRCADGILRPWVCLLPWVGVTVAVFALSSSVVLTLAPFLAALPFILIIYILILLILILFLAFLALPFALAFLFEGPNLFECVVE